MSVVPHFLVHEPGRFWRHYEWF